MKWQHEGKEYDVNYATTEEVSVCDENGVEVENEGIVEAASIALTSALLDRITKFEQFLREK